MLKQGKSVDTPGDPPELRGVGALFLFRDKRLTAANQAARDLLGFDSRASLEQLVRALDPEGELGPDLAAYPRAGAVPLRMECHSRNGESLFLELQISAIGGAGDLLALAFDCTGWREMERQFQRRLAFERLISEASAQLIRSTAEELDGTIESVLGSVGTFFSVDRAYVFLFDMLAETQTNSHEWVAPGISREAHNLQDVPLDTFPWLLEQLRADQVFRVGRISEMPSDAVNERVEFEREGIQSILIVPLWRSGELLGFVGFDAVRAEVEWGDHFVIGLRLMAQMLASSVAARDMSRQLQRQVMHDDLTGLPNRKMLEQEFEHVRRSLAMEEGTITLALVDVDDFKQVNDLHGHEAGDEVLCAVASRLQETVQPGDTVARLGGDEFVILTRGTGSGQSSDLGALVQANFTEPMRLAANISLSVGVSVGLADAKLPEQARFNAMLRRADQAMYEAKAGGKHRSVRAAAERRLVRGHPD